MRPDDRFKLRLILAGAAVLWAAALPLAAFAARLSDGTPSTSSVFALAVYEIGGIVCHQRPERSFHLANLPMPVCARCTGIYAGAAIAAVVAAIWLRSPETSLLKAAPRQLTDAPPQQRPAARATLAMAAIPALATLLYEWTIGDAPSNELRALTGVILGAAVAYILSRLE